MREFEFLEPASVVEASRMLADLGDDCRVIAEILSDEFHHESQDLGSVGVA